MENNWNPKFNKPDNDPDESTEVIVKERVKVQKPPRYKVLIHNDDYTTMEFVILVLKKFFNKTQDESMAIMLKVHHDGVGICGIYTYEIAETKCQKVVAYARQNGHPLKCTIERE